MKRRAWIVVCLLLACAPASASDRWWFGGAVGLGFGDVTWVSVEPMVGYAASEKVDVGGRLIYRYRDDDRFSPSLTSSDYGASVFGRYQVRKPVFLQVEYEWLSYELLYTDGSTDRDEYGSILAGAGIVKPLGDHSSFFASALYNFSYDDNEPSPYDDPWVVRIGVGFGF